MDWKRIDVSQSPSGGNWQISSSRREEISQSFKLGHLSHEKIMNLHLAGKDYGTCRKDVTNFKKWAEVWQGRPHYKSYPTTDILFNLFIPNRRKWV